MLHVCDQAASDFRLCKWPPPLDSLVDECLARYFDELNVDSSETDVAREQDVHQIITFSHFLPRYPCPIFSSMPHLLYIQSSLQIIPQFVRS